MFFIWFATAYLAGCRICRVKLPEVVPSPACLLGQLLKLWCGNEREKPITWGRCANCVRRVSAAPGVSARARRWTSCVLLLWALPEFHVSASRGRVQAGGSRGALGLTAPRDLQQTLKGAGDFWSASCCSFPSPHVAVPAHGTEVSPWPCGASRRAPGRS